MRQTQRLDDERCSIYEMCLRPQLNFFYCWDTPRAFGELVEKILFIFRELASISNHFQGAGKQALNFGEQESTVRM